MELHVQFDADLTPDALPGLWSDRTGTLPCDPLRLGLCLLPQSMKDEIQVCTELDSNAKNMHQRKSNIFLITFLLLPLDFPVKERQPALFVLSSSPLKVYLRFLVHLENE